MKTPSTQKMDLHVSFISSVKTSFLRSALVRDCNCMENKANWTERKKANSVKSLYTQLVEYLVPPLTLLFIETQNDLG